MPHEPTSLPKISSSGVLSDEFAVTSKVGTQLAAEPVQLLVQGLDIELGLGPYGVSVSSDLMHSSSDQLQSRRDTLHTRRYHCFMRD